jgi:hypothetical protein
MANIKHLGRIKNTGRKVLVAYRTLPGESDSALVIQTENLSDSEHDSLISLVESPASQSAYEFAEVLARSSFSDGSTMLARLHTTGRLVKIKTTAIEMTPSTQATISLDQLNQMIAEQRGISVNDLAIGSGSEVQNTAQVREVPAATTEAVAASAARVSDQPLSDDDLARKFRSDADALYKEAARLRAEAEKLAPAKLAPAKKKTAKAAEEA